MGNYIFETPEPEADNASYPLTYDERNYDLDDEGSVALMEFRLLYEGPLPANGSKHIKHDIRKKIHPQLLKLWKEHPALGHKWEKVPLTPPLLQPAMNVLRQRGYINNVPGKTEVDMLADDFSRCGFRFVPLVNKRFDLVCALNILFLRRGDPGNLLRQDGDIDNRIKTLLDALQVPQDCNELPSGCVPDSDENPFFCLMQNDKLSNWKKVL